MTAFIPTRNTDLNGTAPYDIVVCGAGPAGISAAIAAGRVGASVLLIEPQNCLGGVWTSGLLSIIHDGEKKLGLMVEIRERLLAYGGVSPIRDLYDAEIMKLILDELCAEAGVEVLLHAKVSDAVLTGNSISHVILECKEGRRQVAGRCFVDTTGDGDLAARAGCGFDLGRKEDSLAQPHSLMAVIDGIPESILQTKLTKDGTATCINKAKLLELMREVGYEPSYVRPSIFPLPNGYAALMSNQQYESSGLLSAELTKSTQRGRKEIAETINAMKRIPGWEKVKLVTTAAHIGVREGRRIHGIYCITVEDVVGGVRHTDAIAECTAGIDIHASKRDERGGYNSGDGYVAQPFDIPLRALIARDCDNLLMAGRCISGDYHAHASYRVTGNAVATGEAAGIAAALASLRCTRPCELPAADVLDKLKVLRQSTCLLGDISRH